MPREGDTTTALDFLCWARPGGPWVLTAIVPDGEIETRTFKADQAAALAHWVEARQGKTNLYWMVNPARGLLNKKAKKEDVESLAFLHVDLDPEKGADIATERARILKRLEAFTPRPSAVIDSGGGYQAFWRLDEPLYVGGDPARWGDAEAYNIQLGLLLGGDNTFNCDRIMRLPGSVNLPNEKKRKAGRVTSIASVTWAEDTAYPLGEFTAAPRVQQSAGLNGAPSGSGAVRLSGNLATVLIDDLPERVTLRTRMLIVQGDDPDEPTKYGSRSEVVWAVCCEMIRAGCDDDTIAAVLLDKDYGVSAHCLAQGRPVEYAAKQIQRAREQVEEPLLRILNERHAVIADMGGKCRIISEVNDPVLRRSRISKQSFEDFRNRYMNQRVQVGTTKDGQPVYKPAGVWWLAHPMRRQYTSLIFAPGQVVEDAYNLWQGFSCEAIPGDRHEPYLAHIKNNICSGSEAHYRYLIGWLARAVQRPGEQGEVAVVLRGGRGTGKGTFINVFGSLWGRHFMQVSSAAHLVGQFNAHLRDCAVLFADEAFFAGDKQHESVLKTLITEDTKLTEAKGVDAEVAPNYIHLLMASNSDWVVPAGADERRFYVLDVAEDEKQNTRYFGQIRKAMSEGGRESLLHFLLNYDLTGFDVWAVPQTDALRDQKMHSMASEEAWWFERLMDGRVTSTCNDWSQSLPKDRLMGDYLRYTEAQRINRRLSPTMLGKFLTRVMPDDYPRGIQRMAEVERDDGRGGSVLTRERVYFYDLPTLVDCRTEWDRRYGGPYNWPRDELVAQVDRRTGGGASPY